MTTSIQLRTLKALKYIRFEGGFQPDVYMRLFEYLQEPVEILVVLVFNNDLALAGCIT